MVPTLATAVCVGLLTQVSILAYVNAAALLSFGTILFVAARAATDRNGSRDGTALGRRSNTP